MTEAGNIPIPEDQFAAKNVWVIKYEDADVGDDIFVGDGAEEIAKRTYKQKSQSWNCYLLGPAEYIGKAEAEVRRLSNPITLTEQLTHGRNCAGLIPADEDDCTCGLRWRIQLQTEQNLHAAWMKRATEAEQDNKALRERVERYEKSPYNAAAVRIAELERDLADARKALQYADVVLTTLSDEYPMEICSGLRSTQRMVRAITAPPEPPVTFKGFSGCLGRQWQQQTRRAWQDEEFLREILKPEDTSRD